MNSNLAETLANATAVIPVFTGMTGSHEGLGAENRNSRVEILTPQ